MKTWTVNITIDSRHFDSFEVKAETEDEAIDKAYSQLLDRVAVSADAS
jgi:hypothetical protein